MQIDLFIFAGIIIKGIARNRCAPIELLLHLLRQFPQEIEVVLDLIINFPWFVLILLISGGDDAFRQGILLLDPFIYLFVAFLYPRVVVILQLALYIGKQLIDVPGEEFINIYPRLLLQLIRVGYFHILHNAVGQIISTEIDVSVHIFGRDVQIDDPILVLVDLVPAGGEVGGPAAAVYDERFLLLAVVIIMILDLIADNAVKNGNSLIYCAFLLQYIPILTEDLSIKAQHLFLQLYRRGNVHIFEFALELVLRAPDDKHQILRDDLLSGHIRFVPITVLDVLNDVDI